MKKPFPMIYVGEECTNERSVFSKTKTILSRQPVGADLIWVRDGCREYFPVLEKFQLINHIPHEEVMTRKGLLSQILKIFDRKHPMAPYSSRDFCQETYCLFIAESRKKFLDQLPDKDSEENLWILKPDGLGRGEGVKVIWQFDELKKQLIDSKKTTLNVDGKEVKYVIQRYIKNVLLLEKRKSEIRVYWLIASLDPFKVFMFFDGTVRLNTLPFKLGDYDNQLIHVTNVDQQKNHPDFDPSAVLKWSFSTLQQDLTDKKGFAANFIEDQLKPQLKKILKYVADAAFEHLNNDQSQRNGLFFGLYGADFILDETGKPWLSEIQYNPGLSLDGAVKIKVLVPMLRETAAIMLEIQECKRKSLPLDDLKSVEQFETIV